jgi:hypothetical protein
VATAIIKKRREILFMLNLMRWKRVSETSACLDAKPPGERCLLFYRAPWRRGKKHWWRRERGWNRKYRYPWELPIVDFRLLIEIPAIHGYGVTYLYNQQSSIRESIA